MWKNYYNMNVQEYIKYELKYCLIIIGMPGRSLLEVSDIKEENSVIWPDQQKENSENMIKFPKTTVDNNLQSIDIGKS